MTRSYQSTLTRKGQATIPIELRDELGMKEGDRLIWTYSDGSLTVTTAREVVQRTAGIFKDRASELPPGGIDLLLREEELALEMAMLEDWKQSELRSRR
jgi:AbrB family looped-hinge helix DNA binding protein